MELPGADSTDSRAWKLQAEIYAGLTHQLQSIGDALAWTVLGYRRDVLVSFARNHSPGPMDPSKEGTQSEIDFVSRQWQQHGRLALMHDLTNCLRIGDVTVLLPEQGGVEIHEIKTNPKHKDPAQLVRPRTAVRAVTRGEPLPGDDPANRLITVPLPYTTHLDLLRTGIALARSRGSQTVAVPGGRAIEVYHVPAIPNFGDADECAAVVTKRRGEASRRAGIRGDERMLQTSAGLAGTSPFLPPWGIYPLPPADCADLIANQLIFATNLSVAILQDALRNAGVLSQRTAPGDRARADGTLLRIRRGATGSGLGVMHFHPLLMELVELNTWASGVAHVLEHGRPGTKPWPVYQDETHAWR